MDGDDDDDDDGREEDYYPTDDTLSLSTRFVSYPVSPAKILPSAKWTLAGREGRGDDDGRERGGRRPDR